MKLLLVSKALDACGGVYSCIKTALFYFYVIYFFLYLLHEGQILKLAEGLSIFLKSKNLAFMEEYETESSC